MQHHTKTNGDIALTVIISEFTKAKCHCLLPISEHLPFDLVVYSENCKIGKRIQVKYRSLNNDAIRLELQNTYHDSHSRHHVKHDLSVIDAYAIYCGDNNTCYYLNIFEIYQSTNVIIRTNIPKNLQFNGVVFAPPLEDPLRIFKPLDILEQEKNSFINKVKEYVKQNYSQYTGNNTQLKPVNKDELQDLLKVKTPSELAFQFGVTPATIRRWCREYNVQPTRNGNW